MQDQQKLPHTETHGDKWFTLLNSVKHEIGGVLATILQKGGTRPVWSKIVDDNETVLLAYPKENYVRASTIVKGKVEGKLDPVVVIPLLEGISNRLLVRDTYTLKNGVEGEVFVSNPAIEKSYWFYNPLFFRDKEDLQPEQPQVFALAGLVYGVQKAMLDELTITNGEAYEKHSIEYLANNPDKSRLDVPPLKIPLHGQQVISLGRHACEYQARLTIKELNTFEFGPEDGEKIKMFSFVVNLATEEQPMYVILYASEKACINDLELKEGMDVDLYFWLQGRIDDRPEEAENTEQ